MSVKIIVKQGSTIYFEPLLIFCCHDNCSNSLPPENDLVFRLNSFFNQFWVFIKVTFDKYIFIKIKNSKENISSEK